MSSRQGHASRWGRRDSPNDRIYTPPRLAAQLVALVPASPGDSWLDPFRGTGAFHGAMPPGADWAEIDDGRDFFAVTDTYDWVVSNPPYSCLDAVFAHSAAVSRRGFGYLLGVNNLTPRRIESLEAAGFGLTRFHLSKVFRHFGMSAFLLFERGRQSIITYDRIVWTEEPQAGGAA